MRRALLMYRTLILITATLWLFLPACNGNGAGGLAGTSAGLPLVNQLRPVPEPMPLGRGRRHGSSGKIKHIVIVIQENRSFNNLFYGFPGATTTTYGYDTSGRKITLKPIGLAETWDLDHSSSGFVTACNGTGRIPGTNCQMNGFNKEGWTCGGASGPSCPIKDPPYAYVPHSDTKPYFDMGKQYVVADQMYASNFDGSSFTSHQYIIAAQAEKSVNYPEAAWGCPGGPGDRVAIVGPDRQVPYGYQPPCFADNTLGKEADDAGVTWAYYSFFETKTEGFCDDRKRNCKPGGWAAYQANKYVYYGSDWKKDVVALPSQFLTDVSNGQLRQISWVTPTWTNSDHPGSNSNTGPQWVASVVNAVGQSKYWDSTAIVIFWDDYGGWYDPEPPAYVDSEGLGFRLPMIIISPYAKRGYVSHVHYEHGSILKFVEDQFGLGRLSASDKRATSPEKDCFDFKQPPRPFKAIPTVLGKDYFMHQPLDDRPPDTQ
jgi:phospholipase C